MATNGPNPIWQYRTRKGLSQTAFGELIGVQKAAVSKIERGQGLSPKRAIAIEQATNGELPRHVLRPDLWAKTERRA